MLKIKRLRLGLGWACLAPFMSSCAGLAPCPPNLPPAAYLQEIPEPELKGRSNAALADWALELRKALRLANKDKAALKAWAASDDLR